MYDESVIPGGNGTLCLFFHTVDTEVDNLGIGVRGGALPVKIGEGTERGFRGEDVVGVRSDWESEVVRVEEGERILVGVVVEDRSGERYVVEAANAEDESGRSFPPTTVVLVDEGPWKVEDEEGEEVTELELLSETFSTLELALPSPLADSTFPLLLLPLEFLPPIAMTGETLPPNLDSKPVGRSGTASSLAPFFGHAPPLKFGNDGLVLSTLAFSFHRAALGDFGDFPLLGPSEAIAAAARDAVVELERELGREDDEKELGEVLESNEFSRGEAGALRRGMESEVDSGVEWR